MRALECAQEARAALRRMVARGGLIGLDIETAARPLRPGEEDRGGRALDPATAEIALVQLWSAACGPLIVDPFRAGLEWLTEIKGAAWIAHNAKFELKHLLHAGLDLGRPECSQVLAHTLFGPGRLSLEALADELLGVRLDKSWQRWDWRQRPLPAEALRYGAQDAETPVRLWELLRGLLSEGQERVYGAKVGTLRMVARAELAGVPFDVSAHDRRIAEWRSELPQREAEFAAVWGEVNPASPRMGEALEARLDPATLAAWPRTPSGRLCLSAAELRRHPELPGVVAWLRIKVLRKLLSTYGPSLQACLREGRLYSEFHVCGTATGRWASGGAGETAEAPAPTAGRAKREKRRRTINLQNLPRGAFRELIAAPPGRRLVVADYSQVELRVLALLSGDAMLLHCFATGEDLHALTAAGVAGCAPEEVTTAMRYEAKATNFGFCYGMGARAFRRQAFDKFGVAFTAAEAALHRRTYFWLYGGVGAWQARQAERANALGYVDTPLGRRRYFDPSEGRVFTEACNTPCQAGGAEAMDCALGRLDGRLPPGADVILVAHDELVVECAEADGLAARAAVEQAMIEGYVEVFSRFEGYEATLPGLVNAKVLPSWRR